ncbi:MAG: hypothetical protein B6242_13355 [Anaerolineaceae bacterium 4572_78]|nr:MAG: hypothetical protein B6242_13355 [Anaerolineaceae bacterium 4572_78]
MTNQSFTFRLMSYNILDGGYGRKSQLTKIIRTVNPHVVILCEVMKPAVLKQMADDLGMVYRLANGKENSRKVGILSRVPIIASHSFRPFWGAMQHWLEVTIHLANDMLLTVYCIHAIAFHTWFCERWRHAEYQGLLRHIHEKEDHPHVIGGDFNALMPHDKATLKGAPLWVQAQAWFQGGHLMRRALQVFTEANYTDCFRYLNPDEDGSTMPALQPTCRLDYML